MFSIDNDNKLANHVIQHFSKSETPLTLVLGGIRTYSLLIFGQTTKPCSLVVRQENSCLTKLFDLEGQMDSLYSTGSQND